MLIITADIGSYSLKILVSRYERSKLIHLNGHEILINHEEHSTSSDTPRWSQQQKILSNYLKELNTDYYLILNAPSEIFTTRFLDLPIKQKKKAIQMIPFKLEEDIPFSVLDCHIGHSIISNKINTEVLVNISKKSDFSQYFATIKRAQTLPRIVTTEVSAFQIFVEGHQDLFPSSFCIFDLGHQHTKAYYYNDYKLVAVHSSSIAGQALNEMISESYDISLEDTSLYKHKNCFFLTSEQFDQVEKDQVAFGRLMEKTFHPLINEMKRWELGFRVKYGVRVKEIFITGGTSNVKNIAPYLTQELGVPTSLLSVFNTEEIGLNDSQNKGKNKFSVAHILSQSFRFKSKAINLLSADFSLDGQEEFPIYSLTFLANRALVVTTLLLLFVFVERIFIQRDLNVVNEQVSSIIKNPVLELTARQKRLALQKPNDLNRKLLQKSKYIQQEVKLLQSAANINSLSILSRLGNILKNKNAEIIQFAAISGGDFSALIKTADSKELASLAVTLEESDLKNIFVDKDENKLMLTVSGVDEQ